MNQPHSFLFMLFLCWSMPLKSGYSQEVVSIGKDQEDIVINPHAYILKDKTVGIQEVNKVIAAPDNAFIKNHSFQEVHYGFSQPSGWCRFAIRNTSDHTDWVIKVHQSRVDTVQLYVQWENGELIKYPMTGHFQLLQERAYHSLSFGHRISIAKNETIVCYLFTMRKFARHAAVLNLQTESYYQNYETRLVILTSALMGICFLAALIGLVLFIVLLEGVYIYYSIYCLVLVALISVDIGFLYAFIDLAVDQKLVNNLSIVFYYLAVGWHILFTIELLRLKKHRPRWMYWLGMGSGLLFCSVALILLLPIPDFIRRQLSQWSYYIVIFLDGYILYALIIQLFKKEVVVYFYLGGFLFTLVAASIAMLADLQWIEGVNHRTDILFIAPVIEIVCMVIGLGINSSRYVKERIKAQRQIITVQENERERIARDLHDDVGNSLAAVKNMLVQQKDSLLIEKEIDEIIRDIRNISHDLMPVDFKQYALTDTVRQTVNKFKNHPHIQFEYNQTGVPIKLHPIIELVVYRIINELITNSIKHSQATHVMIQLIYQEKSLMLMVEDNGIGMEKEAGTEGGIGLKNIQHRVDYIKATLTVESDSKGSLFIIEIPYGKE